MVVTGSQQALHLLISLPFPNGKQTICVEQPTHPSMIESLRHQNARTTGIEIHRDGPDLSQLEHIFRTEDIKFFYTVSRFHNPTGYSYSNKQRKRIVELAQKYDVFIVEDDYMGDLDHNKKQDPMFAFDPSGRVIYTKSFSKVLLPGLRLGLVVLPDSLKENFLRGKFGMDVHTPILTQGALEIYLKSGMYGAHIHKLRNLYHQKGIIAQKAYQNYLPANTAYTGSNSGFYSSIELPHPLKATHFVQHLKKRGFCWKAWRKCICPISKN
ncbi:PLP-dependent aminotransferase family protein [Fictibacillus enclensis]|uniref:aminotransferase-like domain-containing protein n=1 Tax=Fictibacillus enclensis TaxID=1017270 RepID=UPI0024C00532|nr:PLP-dependent aminotransferase family protein [Fictibacillus enclensis]WHY73556.1 PLP-dependent aminotransferase family protein [Fictibacillus enclensis]